MITPSRNASRRSLRSALVAGLLGLSLVPAFAAGTLDKARDTGKLTFGYTNESRPYSYADAAGKPAGYAIALCNRIAESLKTELKQPALAIDYVALTREEAFAAVQQGKVDLLCGAVPTLERRASVDFSIPIMLSGAGVALRADAPTRLLQAVSGATPTGPAWRASPDQAPQRAVVAVVGGAPIETSLNSAMKQRHLSIEIVPVKDTAAGLEMLAMRKADAFIQDRAVLLDSVTRRGGTDLVVAGRTFRQDVVAMAMRRDDADFRLFVDRVLSRTYRTPMLSEVYTRHFGTPTPEALNFFKLVSFPD
jgi:ABC-type amino acid transport substrate-binding protein